jgi:hypothetical protein
LVALHDELRLNCIHALIGRRKEHEMATRKPRAEAPAFPAQPDAASAGFTKQELAAVFITAGIFAGPYGETVMLAKGRKPLEKVVDAALDVFDVTLDRIHARAAA